MAEYAIEIKTSAQRELDSLEERLFRRIDIKILGLAGNARLPGCKSCKVRAIVGASE